MDEPSGRAVRRHLRGTSGPAAIDALRDAARARGADAAARRARSGIIRAFGAARRQPPRRRSSAADQWFAQRNAARAARRDRGAPEAVPLLQPLLRGSDPRVMQAAVAALVEHQRPGGRARRPHGPARRDRRAAQAVVERARRPSATRGSCRARAHPRRERSARRRSRDRARDARRARRRSAATRRCRRRDGDADAAAGSRAQEDAGAEGQTSIATLRRDRHAGGGAARSRTRRAPATGC